MCSIAGSFDKKQVQKMLEIMKHRAPHGSFIRDIPLADGRIFYLGGGNLAITDPARRDTKENLSPISYKHYTLSFNGEIYNYKEIRETLQSKGHTFKTDTDTEVVIHAYDEWGTECFNMFDGMFALAVVDSEKSKIVIARDIMGEKPLYYRYSRGFSFASEAKVYANTASFWQSLPDHYQAFQSCYLTTLYMGVKEVLPATYMTFEGNSTNLNEYWTFKPRYIDPRTVLEELEALLVDSVSKRLPGVKYALYLSNGVDSGLLHHIIKQLDPTAECPVITFDEDSYKKKDFQNDIKKVVHHLDFPVGSFSSTALYNLAKKAKGMECDVVISGEGADEVFGGYMRYLPIGVRHGLRLKYPSYKSLFELGYLLETEYPAVYTNITCRSDNPKSRSYARQLIQSYFAAYGDPILAMQMFDIRHTLPSLLQMGDRMASAFGIENRCPFLSKPLLEFGLSLPPDLKIQGITTKYLLRRLADKWGVKYETEKRGLGVKYNKWNNVEGYDRTHYFDYVTKLWENQYE